jgi:immune inhibitor A
MRVRSLLLVSMAAVLLMAVWLSASATPAMAQGAGSMRDEAPKKVDDRMDPATKMQRALHQKAAQARVHGKAYGHTHQVAKGQYVELEREGEDPIWTVLGEFGDFTHNYIAEPDRNVDNTTLWTPDFSRDYYMGMLFAEGDGVNSMRNYYIEQSSNRYTVHGDVTDWTVAPGPACSYDDDLGGPAVWQLR